MSFLGAPYTHDIFISYNHGDVREKGAANFMRWSRCFWEALCGEFDAHDDLSGMDIFFDQSPDPSSGVDPFVSLDPQLEAKVKASAVFMPLISPRYLRSKWCQRELSWWLRQQKNAGHETSGRLTPLFIWGTPPEGKDSWVKALESTPLKQLTGVYFFAKATAQIMPQPFGWPATGGQIDDRQFDKALLEAVGYIRLHLLDFKKRLAERGVAAASGGRKPMIYLHGRTDARKPWDKTFRALKDAGFSVRPKSPEIIEGDNRKRNTIREKRVETMSVCDALFIVAPDDDEKLNKELLVVGQHERGLAIDHAVKKLGNAGKRLPFAVVDPVRDRIKAARRQRDLSQISVEWFKLNAPRWVDEAAQWLKRAA